MPTTSWGDAEDDALQGLTLEAQVIYLRLIRRKMDYATGISGETQRITELCMRQVIEYIQPWGSNQPKPPPPTRDYIRAREDELKRAGLIESISRPGRKIFRCLLAATDKNVQKRNTRGTPEEHPEETPINDNKVVDYQRQDKKERQEEKQGMVLGAPGNPVSGNPVKPIQVIRGMGNNSCARGEQVATPASLVCHALVQSGVTPCNPQHPVLIELCAAGATAEEFALVAGETRAKGPNRFAYVLKIVQRRREEAAALVLHHGRMPNKAEALEASNRAATAHWVPPECRGERPCE